MIFLPQRYLGYENENSQWDTINHSNGLVQTDWTKWLCVYVENKIIKTIKEFITFFYVSRDWEKDKLRIFMSKDVNGFNALTLIYRVLSDKDSITTNDYKLIMT